MSHSCKGFAMEIVRAGALAMLLAMLLATVLVGL